jgi:hypothetical protein
MGGSAPTPPAVSVPPPIPAVQSPQGIQAGKTIQQRAQSATGPAATVETGPNGLTAPATTGTKTLLGS